MPTYEFTDPATGRTIEIDGPTPPPEAVIRQMFAELGPSEPAPRSTQGEGEAPTDRSAASRFLGGAWEMLNPVAAVQGLVQAASDIPGTARALADASMDQIQQGAQAGREGRWGEAIARTAAGVPLVGPLAAGIVDRAAEGDVAGALGNVAGLLAGPAALKGLTRAGKAAASGARAVARASGQPAPVADAVRWGMTAEGIPVDAATATGNPALLALQWTSDRSLGGAPVSRYTGAKRDAALTRTAERLADRTGVGPKTAEQAGEGVRDSVEGVIRSKAGEADEAYTALRQMERGAEPDIVPKRDPLAPAASVDPDRAFFLRWMLDDLSDVTFQKQGSAGRNIDEAAKYNIDQEAEAAQVMRRSNMRVAGSQVQHMLKAAGLSGSKADQVDKIRRVLTGQSQNPRVVSVVDIMRQAWDGNRFDLDLVPDEAWQRAGMARGEFRPPSSIPRPDFPGAEWVLGPDAAMGTAAAEVPTEAMRLAVDLSAAKESLKPMYQQMMRAAEIAPAMGAEAQALRALDRLMTGPDFAPLSVVDEALGQIKALARGAEMPELRTLGQGRAAQAVKELDAQVQMRAEAAGPGVLEALQRGRAATIAKYDAAAVRKLLRDEPVQTFRALTAAKDSGIERLRDVARLAPGEMPKVGRAILDDMIERATAKGDFRGGQGLAAEWNRLGKETKAVLFPDAPLRADLDRFFLLIDELAKNPNPSGSAATALVAGQAAGLVVSPATGVPIAIGGAALSGLLRNQRFVRLLMDGMKMPRGAAGAAELARKLTAAVQSVSAKVPGKAGAYPAGAALSQQTTAPSSR